MVNVTYARPDGTLGTIAFADAASAQQLLSGAAPAIIYAGTSRVRPRPRP